jgi:hypothetical protein
VDGGGKLADARSEGGVGAYSKKVGSGDNVTELAERNHARDSVAGECHGGRAERMIVKNQTDSGTGNMARLGRHRMIEDM